MPTLRSGSETILEGDVIERHLSYWKKQLDGTSAALNLPFDRPRPQFRLSMERLIHLS